MLVKKLTCPLSHPSSPPGGKAGPLPWRPLQPGTAGSPCAAQTSLLQLRWEKMKRVSSKGGETAG